MMMLNKKPFLFLALICCLGNIICFSFEIGMDKVMTLGYGLFTMLGSIFSLISFLIEDGEHSPLG